MGSSPTRPCACTGVRWCARCREGTLRARLKMDDPVPLPPILARRPDPSAACEGPGSIHVFDSRTQVAASHPPFTGLRVYPDFVSESEARSLLEELETEPFLAAQSGKAKQHYGPKINFNKNKMNASRFRGIPDYAARLEERMRRRISDDALLGPQEREILGAALDAFQTTDVFVLRYRPEESSNLDLHLDDPLAYGELIADLSLESDSVLTFIRGRPNSELHETVPEPDDPVCIRVPLPARSLAVLYGPARYDWEHGILAYDIEARRTSITLRTLGEHFRRTKEGRIVVDRARQPMNRPPNER